jgi:hypothetical protein
VIKTGMIKWVGYLARMEEMRTKFWSETLKGRDHLEDQGVELILKK